MVVKYGLVIRVHSARKIIGRSSKMCNKAVRGDIGLESLKGRRDNYVQT